MFQRPSQKILANSMIPDTEGGRGVSVLTSKHHGISGADLTRQEKFIFGSNLLPLNRPLRLRGDVIHRPIHAAALRGRRT
jgi:hypothetical protein